MRSIKRAFMVLASVMVLGVAGLIAVVAIHDLRIPKSQLTVNNVSAGAASVRAGLCGKLIFDGSISPNDVRTISFRPGCDGVFTIDIDTTSGHFETGRAYVTGGITYEALLRIEASQISLKICVSNPYASKTQVPSCIEQQEKPSAHTVGDKSTP